MKNSDYFFKIHFNHTDFSIAEMTAFAEDHQARLVENNQEGSLDALIAETATALEAFTGTVGEAKIVKAVQLPSRRRPQAPYPSRDRALSKPCRRNLPETC